MYARLLGWLNHTDDLPDDWQKRRPGEASADGGIAAGLTIVEIIAKFLRHCEEYYADSNEDRHIGYALTPVRDLYGRLPAAQFGPMKLQTVRQHMVDAALTRSGINKRIHRVRRMFKWAVSQELIPATVYEGLKTVDGLKRGRTKAKENPPVGPVADADVDAIEDHVTPPIWAMVQLQRLTGMRPGEVTKTRTKDVDRSGDTWIYKPASHKNQYGGHALRIYGVASDPDGTTAHLIGQKILAGKISKEFKPRTIVQKGWSGLTETDAVKAGIKYLIDLKWVRPIVENKSRTGGRPTDRYKINPLICGYAPESMPTKPTKPIL